jgi:hypothetical protein
MTSQTANVFSKKIMVQQQDSGRWNKSAAILAGSVKRFGEVADFGPAPSAAY